VGFALRVPHGLIVALAAGLVGGAACADADPDAGLAAADAETAAFVNVTVLPMARADGAEALPGRTVVIRKGRIAQIGPSDRIDVPPEVRRIPGAGKFLMPGLVDAHFHLQSSDDDPRLLRILVACGVTSVLNLYGTPEILDLRRRVAQHEVVGPTIYTSGPYISDAPRWQPEPDDVERMVVEQKRAGYDLIKTHGDFSRDAFRRLFAVARREGLKVIGHAPRNLGVAPMFEERMDAVAHGEEFLYAYFFFGAPDLSQADPEARRRFLRAAEGKVPELAAAIAESRIWVVPNLVAYKMIVEQGKDLAAVLQRPETKYLPARLLEEWQPGRNRYDRKYTPEVAEHMTWRLELISRLTGALRAAGVRMMAGSDAPIPGVLPGFSLHEELRLLVAAGLSPYEALRTATANPADFLGRAGEFGTVAVDARADLLLLDADPRLDVGSVGRPTGVMVAGRWLTTDALAAMLAK
jgi:imidazolonepropionase-like amidohydrolase